MGLCPIDEVEASEILLIIKKFNIDFCISECGVEALEIAAPFLVDITITAFEGEINFGEVCSDDM